MKKLAIMCSALVFAIGMSAFTGCGGDGNTSSTGKQGESKVMNVALNPEVEFVLNAEDKVVSVNALNEEGNLIITAAAFDNVEGKTAEEAARLFVQVSQDTGFLVEGNVTSGENQIQVAFSGDTAAATELYNDVKSSIDGYLSQENITASVAQAAAITEAQLEALVAECAPYIDAAKVTAMEYSELLTTLTASRQETAEFYSQELKNAYYEAKAFAMEQAELQTLKAKLPAISQMMFDGLNTAYTSAVELLENTRMTMLVNEDSPYQVALQSFRTAKTQYLNYRNYVASLEQNQVTTQISQLLASYQTAVDNTETALLQAGQTANDALDQLKATAKQQYDAAVQMLEEASVTASAYLTEISTAQTTAQAQFFTQFETDYAAAKAAAEQQWTQMATQLQNGANAQ